MTHLRFDSGGTIQLGRLRSCEWWLRIGTSQVASFTTFRVGRAGAQMEPASHPKCNELHGAQGLTLATMSGECANGTPIGRCMFPIRRYLLAVL